METALLGTAGTTTRNETRNIRLADTRKEKGEQRRKIPGRRPMKQEKSPGSWGGRPSTILMRHTHPLPLLNLSPFDAIKPGQAQPGAKGAHAMGGYWAAEADL